MFGLLNKRGEEILPVEYRWLRMSEGWSDPEGILHGKMEDGILLR